MGKLVGALRALGAAFALNAAFSCSAIAWGEEGHRIVALIAQSRLDPAVRNKVKALLAADTDALTGHDIAAAATWADRLRDSNENGARLKTRQWHFVDIEMSAPNLDQACFGHQPVPFGALASHGPAQDCIIDKIQAFATELASPATNPEEQIMALKFLLRAAEPAMRPEMMLAIKAHSPQSWAHVNMLGEYDFSEEKLTDSFGILPPKSAT